MNYSDLTIHQKIGLKGFFYNDEKFFQYKLIMITFNFKVAIEYFLNGDINYLYKQIDNSFPSITNLASRPL